MSYNINYYSLAINNKLCDVYIFNDKNQFSVLVWINASTFYLKFDGAKHSLIFVDFSLKVV